MERTKMTEIPYASEATVGRPRHTELQHEHATRNFFPKPLGNYQDENRTIRCRLLFAKYSRPQAVARCIALHGSTFDECFVAGRYFVFRSFA